jgi:hypothetical protein
MNEIDKNIEGIIYNNLVWCPLVAEFMKKAYVNMYSKEITLTDVKYCESHQSAIRLADGSIQYNCNSCKFEGLHSPRAEAIPANREGKYYPAIVIQTKELDVKNNPRPKTELEALFDDSFEV